MGLGRRRRAAGELEDEVLGLLWGRREPMTVSDVSAALGGTLAYTTVMTILARMHEKGLLDREPRGRAFAYRATTDRAGGTAARMRRLLDQDRDRDAVLMRFVDALPPEDERVLRDLLAGRSPGGGAQEEGDDRA